jgi:hypothetical protein
MPRIAPDLFDQIVWPLTETSGAYRNVGALFPNDPATDLSITNTVVRTGSGLFSGNSIWLPSATDYPAGSAATRNYIAGAKTFNPAPPFTVSCWVHLRAYTTAQNTSLIRKEYRDSSLVSSWTTPFQSIGITTLTTNGGGDWQVNIGTNNTTQVVFTVTDFLIPLGVWSHIGFTHDGSNIRLYLNGCQCMFYSGATQFLTQTCAAPSYTDGGSGGFGNWSIGAITATGSTNKEEPNANIQDVRISNVVRPLSYFKNIYYAGALPLRSGGFASAQYFKLRAYDTSCVTPTAVTWVDTQVSLANAPPFPCSGPYTTPEVLDTWYT